MTRLFIGTLLSLSSLVAQESNLGKPPEATKGVLLETLSWVEAEKVLTTDTVVVIPLGNSLKEHGPHLQLNNDWLIAEHFKRRVVQEANCVVTPTVPYFYYPTFKPYPGSTTIGMETATRYIADLCRSFMQHGVRRFYILNTGVTTLEPLHFAKEKLAQEGAVFEYADFVGVRGTLTPAQKALFKQERGTHADEYETSLMLAIAPKSVDMTKAVKEYPPRSEKGPPGPKMTPTGTPVRSFKNMFYTRNPKEAGWSPSGVYGIYSSSGISGDATLATLEKGKLREAATMTEILKDIERVRTLPLPKASVPASIWPVD